MSFRLTDGKIFVEDKDLYLATYLSGTRLYLRDGECLRQYYQRFFPQVGKTEEGEFYYDLNSLEYEIDADSLVTLKNSKIPEALLAGFEDAITISQLSSRRSFNEEVAFADFTLPDPKKHPDLYLTGKSQDGEGHFIVLWGLYAGQEEFNFDLTQTAANLRQNFIGGKLPKKKRAAKKVVIKAPALKKEKPTKEPEVEKANEVEPKMAKPKKPIKIPYKTLGILGLAAVLVFGLIVFSPLLLGPKMWERSDFVSPISSTISLKASESAESPDGIIFGPFEAERNLTLLPKKEAGAYRWVLGDSEEHIETFEIALAEASKAPIVNLDLSAQILQVGESVTASLGASHNGDGEVNLNRVFLSWGRAAEPAQESNDPAAEFTTEYSEPGEYSVTAIVENENGIWEYLTKKIVVVDEIPAEIETNLAPIVIAELKDAFVRGRSTVVRLSIVDAYDLDGEISSILVDWGDGSDPVEYSKKSVVIEHSYGARYGKVVVQVYTVDGLGTKSTKPSKLEIDLKSEDFEVLQKEPVASEKQIFDEVWHPLENSDYKIRYQLLGKGGSDRNLARFSIFDSGGLKAPFVSGLKWTILDSTSGNSISIENQGDFLIELKPANYRLLVEAKDRHDNLITSESTVIVDEVGESSGLMRVLNRLSGWSPIERK